MRDAPTISVIICAYTERRWDDLRASVDSVRRQSVAPLEIIVVVDHNAALLARARELPGVSVVANTGAPGLSGARNSGVAAAAGAVVAFLDDDAVATPTWLEALGACYADPLVAGVGGSIEPLWEAGRPGWFPEEFGWVVGCSYTGLPARPTPVRNLIGANMSVRRAVCAAVGGFRDDVGQVAGGMLRCDDTEFCIRVGQHMPGRRFLYAPEARVLHRVGRERSRWRYFRTRCYTEGQAKAQITALVGSRDGLAAERSYTLRVLPLGVGRNLARGIAQRDGAPLARAGAIVAGFALTAAGYLGARLGRVARSAGPGDAGS